MRARYYDPTTGRFITKDPVAGTLKNPLSQNAYIYGYDNPINRNDPSGEDGQQITNGTQILLNYINGKNFESYVLSLFRFSRNYVDLRKFGFGRYIPDILDAEKNIIGEIKSGSYVYLSSQLRAFLQYAVSSRINFTLYIREGVKLSQPLRDAINAIGGIIKGIPVP